MQAIQRIRNYLSMILIELPLFVIKLYRNDGQWMYITNRNEKYVPAPEGLGVSMLDDYTSMLRVANKFSVLSSGLFKKACQQFPFILCDDFDLCPSPKFSFIIGHRGLDKIQNLNCVIQSIAAQSNKSLECIVIEQSSQPTLINLLPKWVRYYHQKVNETQLYNRSSAFNFGVEKAKGDYLILHDNDLVIPTCYTDFHLRYFSGGYDLVNLKRYIFGLSQTDTEIVISDKKFDSSISPEYILQNAKGGGSLAITKTAYQQIGGFDNQFSGWGGEDNELWQRAQILNIYPYSNLPMIHLWHQQQTDKRGGQHGGGLHTEKLMIDLSRVSIYERITHLKDGQ